MLDKRNVISKLNRYLKGNYYTVHREWPYKDVPRRIIAEQYIEDNVTMELRDYNFFCFNGIAKLLNIASDRQNSVTETKFDFFDMDFNHIDVKNGHPNTDKTLEKPVSFNKMKEISEKLSQGIPVVRIDFYEVNCNVCFEEITFSH